MEENTKEKLKSVRTINVNNIKGNGIKYDSVGEFSDSFFRDNYYDAFLMTAEVIKRNGNMDTDKHPLNQNRIYNMITFSGDRGTGKTSVMYSFLEALNDIHNNGALEFIEEYEKRQGRKGDSVKNILQEACFICLEEIDASLLEKQEDILEVILAKMFYQFEQSSEIYDARRRWEIEGDKRFGREDVIRTFEKLFKSNRYIQHSKENDFDSGESTTEILGNLSQSLTLRNTFQEFIPKYLKAIRPGGDRSRYLVISIDDLDMSADGYEKLEKLHRYLMVPGVIIYLAASGNELESICRRHFREVYTDNAEHLSMAYLEKVLPFSQRVYLPSVLNSGFDVVIGGDNLPVRDTILRKIIRRTRVAYDGCSMKTHYYEVGNLRTFVNLYIFLDHMERLEDAFPIFDRDELVKKEEFKGLEAEELQKKLSAEQKKIEEEQRRYLLIFDTNTEKLRNDVINRLAANKLVDRDQRKCFQIFCEEDATRREISFVNWVLEHLDASKESGISFAKEYEEVGYNYGEFFHSIYALGCEKNEYRTLRHCILAIETIMMTRNHMHAYLNPDAEVRKKSMLMWQESISDSLLGAWTNELLPKFVVEEKDDNVKLFEIGYIPKKEVALSFNVADDIDGVAEAGSTRKDHCIALIEKGHLVEQLEILFMFLGPIRKKDVQDENRIKIELVSVHPEKNKDSSGQESEEPKTADPANAEEDDVSMADTKSFKVSIMRKSYTFDILGFAVNYMYDETMFFYRVENWILSAMKSYMDSVDWNTGVEEELRGKIKEHSIYDESWYGKYRGMALPAYSADIMYKLIRRIINENRKRFPSEISSGILEQIREFYDMIEQNLAREDEFYKDIENEDGAKTHTKSCGVNYKSAFTQCPFIGMFRDLWQEEEPWKSGTRMNIELLLKNFWEKDIRDDNSTIDDATSQGETRNDG